MKDSVAETLRASLSAQDQLLGLDPELGAARSIHMLVANYKGFLQKDLADCGLRDVQDTPSRAGTGTLNTFAVRLRGPQPCADVEPRFLCEALIDNCLTVETSIFCDYDYLLRLPNQARAAYFYLYMGAREGEPTLLPSHSTLLLDFGSTQRDLRRTEKDPEYSPSERGAAGFSHTNGSILVEMMEFVVGGVVIGHELAHLEANACGGIPEAVDEGIASELDEYFRLVCDPAASRTEIAADLRGIELAREIMQAQVLLVDAGYSEDDSDPVISRLWKLRSLPAFLALLKALEYDLIMGRDVEAGLAVLEAEPDIDGADSEAFVQHYVQFGYSTVTPPTDTEAPHRSPRHLDPAYRASLLLRQTGTHEATAERRREAAAAAPRLSGFVLGRLAALRELQCQVSGAESRRDVETLWLQSLGIADRAVEQP